MFAFQIVMRPLDCISLATKPHRTIFRTISYLVICFPVKGILLPCLLHVLILTTAPWSPPTIHFSSKASVIFIFTLFVILPYWLFYWAYPKHEVCKKSELLTDTMEFLEATLFLPAPPSTCVSSFHSSWSGMLIKFAEGFSWFTSYQLMVNRKTDLWLLEKLRISQSIRLFQSTHLALLSVRNLVLSKNSVFYAASDLLFLWTSLIFVHWTNPCANKGFYLFKSIVRPMLFRSSHFNVL